MTPRCPECAGPLQTASLSFSGREDLRTLLRAPKPAEFWHHSSTSNLTRLGIFTCCSDCFWFRVALLLGYCYF